LIKRWGVLTICFHSEYTLEKCIQYKNPQNKTKYEEARTEANMLVRKAKYEYERTIAINMKEDNKIFWKFIKSKTKAKESIPCIIDDEGGFST
jgi:hypothetical protein